MSALLAAASASFTYQGASITLSASSATELIQALAAFGIKTETAAANDSKDSPAGNAKPARATAPAGSPAAPTAAPSAPAAAAAAAQGDAGNAAAASPSPAAAAASTASSSEPAGSPAVTLPADPKEAFDVVKKAFLELANKADGRSKCEGVLKPFKLAKLSEAKPEQYAAVLAEIQKASA